MADAPRPGPTGTSVYGFPQRQQVRAAVLVNNGLLGIQLFELCTQRQFEPAASCVRRSAAMPSNAEPDSFRQPENNVTMTPRLAFCRVPPAETPAPQCPGMHQAGQQQGVTAVDHR